MTRTPAVRAFWAASGLPGDDYDVVAFGDSPAMADELGALVLSGVKRATAGLLRDFDGGKEPLPRVGGHVVFVGGDGRPLGIWRTTETYVKPFRDADEAFARDEGEGERTLAWWTKAHREFFERQAAKEGFTFHDGMDVVFERFAVVWPKAATPNLLRSE